MKLAEIASPRPPVRNDILVKSIDREEQHPEVAALNRARGAMIAACSLLSYDERTIADLVLRMLDADPSYLPSMTVLDLLRAVCAKLALCNGSGSALV